MEAEGWLWIQQMSDQPILLLLRIQRRGPRVCSRLPLKEAHREPLYEYYHASCLATMHTIIRIMQEIIDTKPRCTRKNAIAYYVTRFLVLISIAETKNTI